MNFNDGFARILTDLAATENTEDTERRLKEVKKICRIPKGQEDGGGRRGLFWKSEKRLRKEKGRVVNQKNYNELRFFSTAPVYSGRFCVCKQVAHPIHESLPGVK